MNNKFVTIIITFILFGLLIGAIILHSNKEGLEHENDKLKNNIDKLEEQVKTSEEALAIMEAQNNMLKDSIEKLNITISKLRLVIAKKNKEIKELKKKASRYEGKIAALSKQISKLVLSGKNKQTTIDKLEAEKAEYKKKRELVYKNMSVVDLEKGDVEDQELSYLEEVEINRKITDIVNNTRVTFKIVSLRRGRFKREFTHLSSMGKNWNYSLFEVKLDHKHIKELFGEQFVFRIYDKDNAEYVAYTESNPSYPESDQGGYTFKFDGNIVEIHYTNEQEKKGKNYETHIFLNKNGDEYLLNNSVYQIINKGKAKLI